MSENEMKFVIADDHPLFRSALKEVLKQIFNDINIFEASSFESLQEVVSSVSEPDLVLLDLCMPGVCGFSGLIYLRGQFPSYPVVVISANEDPAVISGTIRYGASGYITKSSSMEQMAESIKSVLAGNVCIPPGIGAIIDKEDSSENHDFANRLSSLTPKQFTVLGYIVDGLLNKQIADEMDISEATVKAHVTAILSKLEVNSRTQAVIAMGRLDIYTPDSPNH